MEWGRAAPITGLATRGTREPKGSTNPTTVLFLWTQPEDPEQGSCRGGRSNSWPGTQDRSAESPQILRASLPSLIPSLVSPFHSLTLPATSLSWELGWALEIVTYQNPGPVLRIDLTSYHLEGDATYATRGQEDFKFKNTQGKNKKLPRRKPWHLCHCLFNTYYVAISLCRALPSEK